MLTTALRSLLLLAVAAVVVAGCGSDSDGSSSDSTKTADAGALTHVDGTITSADDGFTLQPKDGGAALAFALGPEVEVGALRALEASGSVARVSYREGDDPLVAAAVKAAPKIGEGMQSYVGTITDVDETSIVLDGEDGERTFDISGAEDGVFDVPHLQEHETEQSPIRVYYDPKAPEVGVAYEDA
jgi:hypothetical protein